MRRWLLVVALVGCSHGGAPIDRCTKMLTKLGALGRFMGELRGSDALSWGVACRDFDERDFRCVDDATTGDDAFTCRHVWDVGAAATMRSDWKGEGPPIDAATLRPVADAVCACHDLGCLVAVGDRMRSELATISTKGNPTDPDAIAEGKRFHDCEDAAEPPR